MVRARSGLWIPPRMDPIVVTYGFPILRLDALPGVQRAVAPFRVQSASSDAVLDAAIGRPGTLLGDLLLIASPHTDAGARLAAVDRTVERIPWHPHRPRVRRSLALRAALDGRDAEAAKRQELRAAVFLVMGERSRPQVHRFGPSWLTDDHGRRQPVVPEHLPLQLFWRWFQDEVRKAAEASLTGQAYPPAPSEVAFETSNVALLPAPALEPGPLEVLLDEEHQGEVALQWEALLARATPRQRQLLRALAASDSATPTLADAARQLDLAPSTARVHWKRLLDQVRTRGL